MTPDRRLLAQRAVVAALRARVDAAIRARDEEGGQLAHDALIRAELRLHRMEGFPVAGCASDVVERW